MYGERRLWVRSYRGQICFCRKMLCTICRNAEQPSLVSELKKKKVLIEPPVSLFSLKGDTRKKKTWLVLVFFDNATLFLLANIS